MKVIVIILFTLLYFSVYSQHIVLQFGAEKTVAGNQLGTAITAETKKLWGLGVFYQGGVGKSSESNTTISNPFYGLNFQAPVARCERLTVFATLRAGLVDEKFFVLVPSIETRLSLGRRTGITFGSGIRMGHPSLLAKVFVKIF